MSHLHIPQFARIANLGWSGASMTALTVVSANTKTAWVEVSSSLPFDCDGLMLQTRNVGANFQTVWFDVGVGGAGSEVVVVSNWPDQRWSSNKYSSHVPIPVKLKAGQRVAIRCQSTGTPGGNVSGALAVFSGGFDKIGPFAALDVDIGKDMANSRGTSVTPGTSAEGSWTELTSSLSRAIKGFYVHQTNGANSDALGRFEIGIGAAASEVALTPYFAYWQSGGNPPLTWENSGPWFFPLPAGTRIAARARSNAAEAIRLSLTGLR